MTVNAESSSLQTIDFSKGIHGNSDAAAIPDGYCMDAENCDFSEEGVVRKRTGYRVFGGLLPVKTKYAFAESVRTNITFDSQPIVDVEGTFYPYGTATGNDVVNSLIDGFYTRSKFQYNNVILLEITDDVRDRISGFTDIYLEYIITSLTEENRLATYPVQIPILFRLTDNLLVLPKEYCSQLTGFASDAIPESGYVYVQPDPSVHLRFVTGPRVPFISDDVIESIEVSSKVKVTFKEPHSLSQGDLVKFHTCVYTPTGECARGLVSTVTDTSISVVILGTAVVTPDYDTIDTEVNTIQFFHMSYHPIETIALKLDSKSQMVRSSVYRILSIATISTSPPLPLPSGDCHCLWVYGVSLSSIPPATSLCSFPSRGKDEVCVISQNWLLVNDCRTSALVCSGSVSVNITSTSLLPVISGIAEIPCAGASSVFEAGDTAYWYRLEKENSLTTTESFEVHSVTPSSIRVKVDGRTRLFIEPETIISRTRTSSIITVSNGDGVLFNGCSITLPTGESVIAERILGDEIRIPKEVEISTGDVIYVDNPFTPVPFSSLKTYPYEGLNCANYSMAAQLYSTCIFGDRLYIATGEGGIWRYNGDSLTSMRMLAPPQPSIRSLIGVPGSLPLRSDTSAGEYAEVQRISVTYYWEDYDGKGYESPYVSSDDLRFRPTVGDGESDQIEVLVPTIPWGVGLPAADVTIRVYHVSEEGDSNIMTLGSEIKNDPSKSHVAVILGNRFTKFFGNASEDQAFIDVARDSPAPAPLAKFLAASNGRLVAANAIDYPSFEWTVDKIFDKDLVFEAHSDLILTGGSKEYRFVTVPTPVFQGTQTMSTYNFGSYVSSSKVVLYKVDSVPPSAMAIFDDSVYFVDASNRVQIEFPSTSVYSVATLKLHALITVFGAYSWSIDYNKTLFTRYAQTSVGGPTASTYDTNRYVESISPTKQFETTSFKDVYPDTKCLYFGEMLRSNGQPFLGELAIFIMNGAVYLGKAGLVASDFNDFLLRFWLWNDGDRTLGNLTLENGRVVDWNDSVVWETKSTISSDYIEYNDVRIDLLRLYLVETFVDASTGRVGYRRTWERFNSVDVSHRPNGNSHGSFSVLRAAPLTKSTLATGQALAFNMIGQSLRFSLQFPTKFTQGVSFPTLGIPENRNGRSTYVRVFVRPSTPEQIASLAVGSRFTFLQDGVSYDPSEIKGGLDLRQEFEVFRSVPNAGGTYDVVLKCPRPANENYDVSSVYITLKSSYISPKLIDYSAVDNELFVPVSRPFTSPTTFGTQEQWVFLILRGKEINECYSSMSGWFKVKSAVSGVGFTLEVNVDDDSELGYNSLVGSTLIHAGSDERGRIVVPIPVPVKEDLYSSDNDAAYPLFTKTTDEGYNPFNSLLARYANAINTVLHTCYCAQFGSSPTGDFASDTFPANGIKVTSLKYVDRYSDVLIGTVEESDGSWTVGYKWDIGNVSSDDYDYPFDKWLLSTKSTFSNIYGRIGGESDSVITPFTQLDWSTRTLKLTPGKAVKFAASDVSLGAHYWWSSGFTSERNEVRLPVFTYLERDTLQSMDREDITGMAQWRDSLIMSKPESVWRVVVGDEAEQRRIQSSVGCTYQGNLLATDIGVFVFGSSGLHMTDGTNTVSVDEISRYFKTGTSPSKSAIPYAVSFYNTSSKDMYIGAPYSRKGEVVSYPNARYRFSSTRQAWSIDTNINSSGYCMVDGEEYMSVWDGYVLKQRTESGTTKYNDAFSPIPFYLRTAYSDIYDPTIKFYRQFILYLGEDSEYTLDVRYSWDFAKSDGGVYDTLPVKPAVFGSAPLGFKSFGGSSYVAPYRVSLTAKRVSHVSLSFENATQSGPVELFGVWLEGQKLNRRPIKEKGHYDR